MIDSALYRKSHDMQKREDFAGWCKFFIILLSVLLLFTIFIRSAFSGIYVIGNSMSPTLSDGDFLIANLLKEPRRDAIVVIKIPERFSQEFTGEYIIKRVIATEGDRIYCEDHVVYLSLAGETEFTPVSDHASSLTPDFPLVEVGEGEIFCMGDNRAISKDSTEVGCFSVSDVYGVVPLWSVSDKGAFTFIINLIGGTLGR